MGLELTDETRWFDLNSLLFFDAFRACERDSYWHRSQNAHVLMIKPKPSSTPVLDTLSFNLDFYPSTTGNLMHLAKSSPFFVD